MREVAWVVFDEIHYMRDKGEHQHVVLDVDVSVMWSYLYTTLKRYPYVDVKQENYNRSYYEKPNLWGHIFQIFIFLYK